MIDIAWYFTAWYFTGLLWSGVMESPAATRRSDPFLQWSDCEHSARMEMRVNYRALVSECYLAPLVITGDRRR